jgi:hypothetical protein
LPQIFQLCISTGAGKWIGDKQTQKNLEQQKVELNISNSSCDSGETISIAGYIFFKHPKYTQQKRYLPSPPSVTSNDSIL